MERRAVEFEGYFSRTDLSRNILISGMSSSMYQRQAEPPLKLLTPGTDFWVSK
jgi:hypothetical protein